MLPCEGALALIVFGHDRSDATSGLSLESPCQVRHPFPLRRARDLLQPNKILYAALHHNA